MTDHISTRKARKGKIPWAIVSTMLAAIMLFTFGACQKRQIAPVEPGINGTITAANDIVHACCYNYTPGASEELRDYSDMYYPKGLDIKWEYAFPSDKGGGEAENALPLYSLVYFSENKDMSDAETYLTVGNSVHIDDTDVNKDYYWQVKAVFSDSAVLSGIFKLHTAHDFRTYGVPGISNTRDLGGYSAQGGKKVRQGMILRGANVDSAAAQAKHIMLDLLGIRTDLDLRAPGEGKAGGEYSPLGKDVNYINISAPLYGGLKDEDKQEAFAQEIRVFTDEANYPVYFHCAIGRDRTGTLAIVLLGLLGVPEKLIERDYEMSFLSYSGSADKTPVETMLGNFDYTVNYLKTFGGKTFKDNVENYLKSIGITAEEIEKIRGIMLE